MPIDHFFHSLAEDQKNNAIGVILSGTASDGALGLKAIKAEGGITFAQDEKSAKYGGMPHSAVAAGAVRFNSAPGGDRKGVGQNQPSSLLLRAKARALANAGKAGRLDFSRNGNDLGKIFSHPQVLQPVLILPITSMRRSNGGSCGAWPSAEWKT